MCGIVGIIGKRKESTEHIIKDMMNTIKHRGPDDDGIFISDDVSFGFVRLAIIDINGGHQPMQSNDDRYTIVFNGEIYNYIELRQYLVSKGYKLKTYSDTEVLLNLYIEFGSDMLQHLNGMFAFAIHDKVENTVFLARDHFGIKPLYYTENKGNIIFASEIKAILNHPEVQRKVDSQSLYEYLTFQMVLKKHTLFQDIYKLEPATYIKIKNGVITEKVEYWSIDYNVDDTISMERYSDELLVLLESSASLQVRSDVPVGAYLSGGLDSSTVAVLASKNYMGKLKTFTGGFKDSQIYDESHYAKVVSDYIGSEHHTIFPTFKDFESIFRKLVYHMDEPGAGPGLFPQYMVSKLASQHVTVVLGGQGGDEIFGGYARYAVAYLEQCLKGAIFENQEEGKHVVTLQSIIPNMPMLKQYLPMIQGQFSSGLFETMDKRYYKMVDRSPSLYKFYNTDLLSQRSEEQIFDKFSQVFNKPNTSSLFNKMTYYDTKTLLPTLLQVEDRVSMAVSIESRVPLLDKRIVELASKMPPTIKFAGGKTKYMLSRAVRNVIPKEIFERKDKMGFPVPINEWLSGPLKSMVLDTFNSQKAKERGIFNSDAIINSLTTTGKFNRDLWGAMNIELWLQEHIDG
jgi:asparagine synthase (glutamine-hydrolysing)